MKLNIPDYFKIIKKPMSLADVKKKLGSSNSSRSHQYKTMEEFANDMRLIYNNAMTYNRPDGAGRQVHMIARDDGQYFEIEYNKAMRELDLEQRRKTKATFGIEDCRICGRGAMQFRHPIYTCSACSKKIKKNQDMYGYKGNDKFAWCSSCFRDKGTTTLVNNVNGEHVNKKDLTRRKTTR